MIKQIIVSRGIAGSIGVRAEPRHKAARFRAWRGSGNERFSAAVGFASRMAAEVGAELVDATGRLSPEECRALVAGWQSDLHLPEAGSPTTRLAMDAARVGLI